MSDHDVFRICRIIRQVEIRNVVDMACHSVEETGTRKEVSDEDDMTAQLETRILARTGSMVSEARACSELWQSGQKRAKHE